MCECQDMVLCSLWMFMVIICSSKYRRKRLWARRGIALQYILWFPTANYTFWQVMAGYVYILSYHVLTLTHTMMSFLKRVCCVQQILQACSNIFKHVQAEYIVSICINNMGLSENSVPLHPMVLLIIIPTKWLFHWGYTLFSDKPILLPDLGIWFIGHIQIRTCTLLVGLHSGFVQATNDDATAHRKVLLGLFCLLRCTFRSRCTAAPCWILLDNEYCYYHNLSRVSLAAFQLRACGWISEVCTACEKWIKMLEATSVVWFKTKRIGYSCLMVFDGFWWFLMVFDGFWWFLMVFDGFWWFLPLDFQWNLPSTSPMTMAPLSIPGLVEAHPAASQA